MSEKLFGYAGVSRHTDGVMTFRVTSRDGYGGILEKEGKTDVHIVALSPMMTKVDAAKFVATNEEFSAEARKVAEAVVNGPAPKPAKESMPKAAKASSKKTVVSTDEVKAANLAKIQAAAARVKAKAAPVVETVEATPVPTSDVA